MVIVVMIKLISENIKKTAVRMSLTKWFRKLIPLVDSAYLTASVIQCRIEFVKCSGLNLS